MKNKLGIIITFAIVAILAITVVVMSLVSVNYKPDVANPYKITITNSNSKSVDILDTNQNYNDVVDEFEKSFTRSFLSAFFAGQTSSIKSVKNTTTLPTFSDYKMTMSYNDPQKLVVNGKEQSYTYNQIIFGVSDTDSFETTTIYFKQTGSSIYYYFDTFSLQANLYELIDGFDLM